MILQYFYLRQHPNVFLKLTGLRLSEFDQLVSDVLPRFEQAEVKRLSRADRQREMGGGCHARLTGRDQLLLTVVWLRQYPTHDVLGYLFGVSQPTVGRYIRRLLPVLEQAGRDTLRRRDPGRKRRLSLKHLLENVPELAVVVDSFEQRVQRPKRVADRDGWYSGKKRQHTVKSQIVVDSESGQVREVSDSVPGRVSDITLLKQSGAWQRVPAAEGILGDAAYQGIQQLHPGGCSPHKKPRKRDLSDTEMAYNHAFSQRRIIVEMTINRLRRYQSLTQMDRQHRCQHTARVTAVAGLVNRQLCHQLGA